MELWTFGKAANKDAKKLNQKIDIAEEQDALVKGVNDLRQIHKAQYNRTRQYVDSVKRQTGGMISGNVSVSGKRLSGRGWNLIADGKSIFINNMKHPVQYVYDQLKKTLQIPEGSRPQWTLPFIGHNPTALSWLASFGQAHVVTNGTTEATLYNAVIELFDTDLTGKTIPELIKERNFVQLAATTGRSVEEVKQIVDSNSKLNAAKILQSYAPGHAADVAYGVDRVVRKLDKKAVYQGLYEERQRKHFESMHELEEKGIKEFTPQDEAFENAAEYVKYRAMYPKKEVQSAAEQKEELPLAPTD